MTKILQENIQEILTIQVETTNVHAVSHVLHSTNILSSASCSEVAHNKELSEKNGSIPGYRAT